MVVRSPVRSPVTSPVVSVTGQSGGGGGITARFVGDPYTEGVNDDAVTIRIRNATIGATWDIEVTSSGGGTPVTDTDTVTVANFDLVLDLTALNAGTLTVEYSEDSVLVATDTALLLIPFDYGMLDFSEVRVSQYVSLI
jgi:hypothetical protein